MAASYTNFSAQFKMCVMAEASLGVGLYMQRGNIIHTAAVRSVRSHTHKHSMHASNMAH